jgi:hypothetical protein
MHRHHITGLALSLGLLAAAPASAQTPVTQTNDINNSVNHPFQEAAKSKCLNTSLRTLNFAKATAPRTVIEHLSCLISLNGNGAQAPSLAELTILGPNISNYLPIFSYGPATFSGGDGYGINGDTKLFASKGDKPQLVIGIVAGSVQEIDCTISGYHSVPGQT